MNLAEEIGAVCAALALAATQDQIAKLVAFLALLQKWGSIYNLTAIRDDAGMLTRHLADSLAVVPAVSRRAAGGRLLDVGSGGGLPGVPLAVMLPNFAVTSVDAVGKKAAFVRHAAATLELPNLRALHARVEHLPASPGFAIITARAFAPLADLVRLTQPLLQPDGVWLAMKARPEPEIAALDPTIDVFHVEPLQVPGLEAQRCLVWMRPRRPPETGGDLR